MPFPKFPALAQNRTLTLSRGASRELPVTARSPDHLSALTCSSELGTPLEMENMGTLFLPLPPLQLPAAPLSWLYTPYIFENRRKEHFFTFAIYFEKFKWRMMWSCNIPLFFFPLSVHTTRREEIWVLNIGNTLGRNRGKWFLPSHRADEFEGMNYFMWHRPNSTEGSHLPVTLRKCLILSSCSEWKHLCIYFHNTKAEEFCTTLEMQLLSDPQMLPRVQVDSEFRFVNIWTPSY